MFFDSHAHYDDKAFEGDRDELLASLPEGGISYVVNAGDSLKSSRAAVALAEKYNFLYAAVGFHPHNADEFTDGGGEEISKLAKHPKVVAIGEIGLDYYYDNSPRDIQKEVFVRQIQIAKEAGLPIIVHNREAHRDILEILKDAGVSGVMHCFSGSVETAREALGLGMYISLAGPVTYKNAVRSIEVAKYVPADRLMIETDCPYLSPVPHRGKRNSSLFIGHTAEKVAEIRGVSVEEIANTTLENAKRLFFKIS